MSVTRQITIWCDKCGEWQMQTATLRAFRTKLRKLGWVHRWPEKDYCPACAMSEIPTATGDRRKGQRRENLRAHKIVPSTERRKGATP